MAVRSRLLALIALGTALVMVLSLAAGCAQESEVIVDESSDGGTAQVTQGQVLVVRLPGNPTTGYTWTISEAPEFLVPLGDPTFEASSEALGAGGVVSLRFAPEGVGTGTLTLAYRRPWETDQPAERTFTLTVDSR